MSASRRKENWGELPGVGRTQGSAELVCILARCILIWHALYSSSSREDMVSIKNLARTDLKDYKRGSPQPLLTIHHSHTTHM